LAAVKREIGFAAREPDAAGDRLAHERPRLAQSLCILLDYSPCSVAGSDASRTAKFPLGKGEVPRYRGGNLAASSFSLGGAFAGAPESANLNFSGRQFSGTWPGALAHSSN